MERVNLYINAEIHHYHHKCPELNQTHLGVPPASEISYPQQVTAPQPEGGYTLCPGSNSPLALEGQPSGMGQIGCPNQITVVPPEASYPNPPVVTRPEIGQPIYPEVAKPLIPPGTSPLAPEQPSVTSEVSSIEQQIFNLTNTERTSNGLPPLQFNQELHDVAKRKSQNMGDLGYFSHNGPDGKTTMDWLIGKGYSFNAWGENIANFQTQATAEEIVRGWMNSPGHRANILASNFTLLGVGVYQNNGRALATQVFGHID